MDRLLTIVVILGGVTGVMLIGMLIVIVYEHYTVNFSNKFIAFSLKHNPQAKYTIKTSLQSNTLALYNYKVLQLTGQETATVVKEVQNAENFQGIYLNLSEAQASTEEIGQFCISLHSALPGDYLLCTSMKREWDKIGEWDAKSEFYPEMSLASNIDKFDFIFINSEQSTYRDNCLMLLRDSAPITSIGLEFYEKKNNQSLYDYIRETKKKFGIVNINSVLLYE